MVKVNLDQQKQQPVASASVNVTHIATKEGENKN